MNNQEEKVRPMAGGNARSVKVPEDTGPLAPIDANSLGRYPEVKPRFAERKNPVFGKT